MPKIPATLVCLCFSLISWTDVHAAATKPKVVIAHAAMNFRVAPLWVAQDQGVFAKYGIDPEVLYIATLADLSQANIPIMNHLMAVKKSYLQRQPEIVQNVLRALIEGLAFTWSPRSKSAVLKSVMRRLRITEMGFAEEGYQDLLTRGGLEKKPHPSLEGVRNVQRLMASGNPRVGEIKLEQIVHRSLVRKLDESGFIDRMYSIYPAK